MAEIRPSTRKFNDDRSPSPARQEKEKPLVRVVNSEEERQFTPEKDRWDGHYEFCGVLGCLGIMLFSHFIMYYFYVCIEVYQGTIVYPGHDLLKGAPFVETFLGHIRAKATPTLFTAGTFMAFCLYEYFLAVVLPGPVTFGLPLPSENNTALKYKCNAISAWYVNLATLAALHYTEVFPLWNVRELFGEYMSCAVILGNVVSVWVYVDGIVRGRAFRMSGNVIYDFFMGSQLNPRLPGDVDLKIFAEIRNSWMLLWILSASCAAKMYKEHGRVTFNMWFLLTAHTLYVNACQKGEECIPTTYDIFYEKFGWMLIFWNFAGVPFLYCFQALQLQTNLPTFEYSTLQLVVSFGVLFCLYYVWDTMNSQKNRFRMKRQGVSDAIIRRKTFPQFSYGYIENPKTIKSERGELFVDGWYKYARKLHYTVDICMAFLWGYSCGFGSFIPFFYVCFFASHLVHREMRDEERCKAKYGALWDKYVSLVPYKLLPGVY